jgi:hypothetical protein
VFGVLSDSIRKGASFEKEFCYFAIDPRKIPHPQMSVNVVICGNKNSKELVEYFTTQRGEIYITSEELNVEDVELAALNDIYMKAGLQRKRSFWLAYHTSHNGPVAAIISYKAPIGLNFSMLENRSELVVTDHISEQVKINACCALLREASTFYTDFPAPFIPLVTEERNVGVLSNFGFAPIRSYNQFTWTKFGYQDWYDALYAIASHSINRWRQYRCQH